MTGPAAEPVPAPGAEAETGSGPSGDADGLAGARSRLAERQAALVAALVARAPAPAGFDERRIGVQAEALLAKRRRVARKAWPELAAALGETFDATFDAYALAHPRTASAAGRPDALAFAAHLRRIGRLPRGFRLALLHSRLSR